MKENNFEDKIFSSPLDLEEERRKLEASDILYRAIKYIIGYLKGYKIEKHDEMEREREEESLRDAEKYKYMRDDEGIQRGD